MQWMPTEADIKQLSEINISEQTFRYYLELFKKNDWFLDLNRPCTVGDGILRLNGEEIDRYIALYEKEMVKGRMAKFVPASGAATRMFQCLWEVVKLGGNQTLQDLKKIGHNDAILFFENLKNFAFYPLIEKKCSDKGFSIDEFIIGKEPLKVLCEIILKDLEFGLLPKALIPFHRYGSELRTAFEEQIIEAIPYLRDGDNKCRLHFTVTPEWWKKFEETLEEVKLKYNQYNLDVTFSLQSPSTNTPAVDEKNRPVRDADGRLLFRPGGHGSLLANLNKLKGDIVFIKNIDNVVPDTLKTLVVKWKKILGGILVELDNDIRDALDTLNKDPLKGSEKAEFICEKWDISLPHEHARTRVSEHAFLFKRLLDRPRRVCGMVPNVGAPGGGPFWVNEKDGSTSRQIVEKAQVDMHNPQQAKIWESSTHFNPVDIVCSLRDFKGQNYDLHRYTNPNAIIITQKHYLGKPIKVLEHPGLWNGSMARWLTVFVEVPAETFQPVKKVTDLLEPGHRE